MSRMNPREVCANCRWWKAHGNGFGDCRVHAPTVFRIEDREGTNEEWTMRWPITGDGNWCGEFSQDLTVGKPE